ncbi:patatin-like phospholipase family protein [Paenibacillus sp. SYP-B3998]|uniref:Patatin-like phospholipase family protein n=1 Tax=Paenibacillus sp. SYP-B3998 TaxID=2678564 RepID=A0A6G3ZZ88_9BACL|nr:patatin-like phospholipase family protein [Paenibacillus sp. SYP-B3998]NEW06891.1 patatin-like phospholipase family protein [Paenibacillus sp. SYP-B3998]
MEYHFKNLVFEGGGVKGIAYIGALEVLDEEGILSNITRVGGTSAGAIISVLVGLGYSTKEIRDIVSNLDFRTFLDESWGLVFETERLIHQFGWYKGDYFRQWIADLVKNKTGNSEATFKDVDDLKKERNLRDLYFIGTNLSTRYEEVFSFEHTPRMCIADAVRISMSIPLFFAAKRSDRGDVYVDGGVLDNYPVKLFDRKKYVDQYFLIPDYYEKHNDKLKQEGETISPYVFNKETLGFRLDSAKEIAVFRDQSEPPRYEIDNLFSYTWSLVETILESQQNQHLHSDDWQRTIYIDTLGVKTTEFDLSEEKKEALEQSGKEYTEKYLKWYNDTENGMAINHP